MAEQVKKDKKENKPQKNETIVKQEDKNYIIAEVNIEEKDINNRKRILNSFEGHKSKFIIEDI